MLRRNIKKPITEIPQVLCTYEEVLDAYHNGLQVPDDVTVVRILQLATLPLVPF